VQLDPESTLAGGILRFESMGRLLVELLGSNVPPGDLPQFVGAPGAAWLRQRRVGPSGSSVECRA
jgi:activator of 2-hydroxyglutaryl-CoA dehydratase